MRIFNRMGKALLAVVMAGVVVGLVGCGGDSGTNSVGGGGGGENDSHESVTISGQKWMKKNLNVSVTDSWCYGEDGEVYNEQEEDRMVTISSSEIQANCAKYGRLYTWQAAKSACQSIGWRLPDTADWKRLVEAAGDIATAGTKLKSMNGWGWNDYNNVSGNGTDDYGFSALPGGYRYSWGNFYSVGGGGHWWTATESDSEHAYERGIGYVTDHVFESTSNKSAALSVRCVKD
jgi:uncharacterized protein (TIGR02145 family)